MAGIILIWLFFAFWYLWFIIWPEGLDECLKKTLEKQEIKKGSKLNYIYINKSAYPKLKIVAYFTIIYFIINIIFTFIIVLLYNLGFDAESLNKCSFIFFMIWLFIGTTLKIVLMKKK